MSQMPSGKPLPPSYAQDKAALWREIRALWRELQRPPASLQPTETIFSFAGTPPEGVSSPPYQARMSGKISKVMVGLGTAGTTESVSVVYINGVIVATITNDPAEQSAFDLPDVYFIDGDFIASAVTTVGDGAKDFSIQVHWV